jgi:integrase
MFCSQGHLSAPLAPTLPLAPAATPATSAPAPKPARKKGRADALPYKEGSGWCIRAHHKGHDIYLSGYKTGAAVKKAAAARRLDIDKLGAPRGRGPDKTTVAQALQDYALDRLPFMKGATQESVRLNRYLRCAGLQTLVVTPCTHADAPGEVKVEGAEEASGAYFEVTLEPHTLERRIPQGLGAHRKAQLTKTGRTEKHRAVLAGTVMSEVTREQLQAFVNAMRRDRCAPATIALHRSIFRVLFNHAFAVWRWGDLEHNPATMLKMPTVDNERKRVMSLDEQALLDAALQDCRNKLAAPVITLLRETAMRASEPLQHAVWRDVDWERSVLWLSDGKNGRREVPLSPVAIQVLRDLGPGEPEAPIVEISYDALKKAMERACERAGIKNLILHDMRRTGATRLGLKTGNLFLVKALTGHKTDVMAQRYLQVGADDVVSVLHAQEKPQPAAPVAVPPAAPVEVPVIACASAPSVTAGGALLTLSSQQLQELMTQAVATGMAGLLGSHPAVREAPAGVASAAALGVPPRQSSNVTPMRRAA